MTKTITLSELKTLAKKYGVTTSGTKVEIAARILKLRGHLSSQAKQGLTAVDRKILTEIVNLKNKKKSSGWFGIL